MRKDLILRCVGFLDRACKPVVTLMIKSFQENGKLPQRPRSSMLPVCICLYIPVDQIV